jgi:hypothetical protein
MHNQYSSLGGGARSKTVKSGPAVQESAMRLLMEVQQS